MASSSSLLLKNGTVIIHDTNDHAVGMKRDLLVRGNMIVEIAPNISAEDGVEVIDCQDKIIAPGFVDTHRHMWNTPLKGRYADSMLISDHLVTAKAAIAGSIVSGLRTIYGYCFHGRVESWSPLTMEASFIPPWGLDSLEELSRIAPFGQGRVTLAVAFDGWHLPKEVVVPMFSRIKAMGIEQITIHQLPPPAGGPSSLEIMESYGLLTSNVILSHANMLTANEISLVKKRNAHISVSPTAELQMGMGTPACFDRERNLQSHCSIGVDSHNVTVPSIPAELRVALQYSRGIENDRFLAAGKIPGKVYKTVQEAYALGTIQAARGIGMGDKIGSLAVGKLADIIIFDSLACGMVCAAHHDPVAAIVTHSTPGHIVTTIVDGVVRKRDGKLEPVPVVPEARPYIGSDVDSLQWPHIARCLLESRARLQSKFEKTNFAEAKTIAQAAFGYQPSLIVDSI